MTYVVVERFDPIAWDQEEDELFLLTSLAKKSRKFNLYPKEDSFPSSSSADCDVVDDFAASRSPMGDLPGECVILIFTKLQDCSDILRCGLVCRQWKRLADSALQRINLSGDAEGPSTEFALPYENGLARTGTKNIQGLIDSIGRFSNLRSLELVSCYLPVWRALFQALVPSCPFLEMLYLSQCAGLERLPESMGSLTSLKSVTIELCWRLLSLPSTLGQLSGLTRLKISFCECLDDLPCSVGSLKKLTHLQLHSLFSLRSLPSSLTVLTFLATLDISDCYWLEDLPASLGNLQSLQRLRLCSCPNLRGLPESFGQLPNLCDFALLRCPLVESLPSTLRLPCLQRMELVVDEGDRALLRLPAAITNLVSLRHLRFSHRKIRALPPVLCAVTWLEELVICQCPFITLLPDCIGHLWSLRSLHLSLEGLTALPENLEGLVQLRTLSLNGCCSLQKLPASLKQLQCLHSLSLYKCVSLELTTSDCEWMDSLGDKVVSQSL